MRCWLTTHWPPREDEPINRNSGIWLPDGRESAGSLLSTDDLVMVYESRSGRTEIRKAPDGSNKLVRCRLGREGIVHYGRVSGPLTADPTSVSQQYTDGTTIWWRWYAPVVVLSRSGFVTRQDTNAVLGYKTTYNFHGFGHLHSGLREISVKEFEQLRTLYHASRPLKLRTLPIPRGAKKSPGGGESKRHKKLKEFVAANPSKVLGEEGLRLIRVEYPFVTGDRVDVVLADVNEQIVGVEIEIEVGDSNHAGPLQAIKYRRMLEWMADRAPGDSRAMLVAFTISSAMQQRCAQYGIECYEVNPDDTLV